jgi:hypothetical protein
MAKVKHIYEHIIFASFIVLALTLAMVFVALLCGQLINLYFDAAGFVIDVMALFKGV